MDQYLTTYKKDYPWPATRHKHRIALLRVYDSCKCHDRPREVKPLVRCGDDYDWSRTGPMGRLLDPKLYPAKTGPHPETEATRFDQPATYMRKVSQYKIKHLVIMLRRDARFSWKRNTLICMEFYKVLLSTR
mgnify:CR=1 FL=1